MGISFARHAAADRRLLKRFCEALLGISAGLLADGELSDKELLFLDSWLQEHDDIAATWPGEVIFVRVRDVLADGFITEEERAYLKETLSALLAGTLAETGATSGVATRLPIDEIDAIAIPDRSFRFTGSLLYGTRVACERAVRERDGAVVPSVRADLDYRVIGTLASRAWANTSHGRKIEKAMV